MVSRRIAIIAVLGLLFAQGCDSTVEPPSAEYVAALEEYREGREQRLMAEDGWLSLVGLHWLEQGRLAFGSDPANPIVFPPGSAPAVAGHLSYDGNAVTLLAAEGAGLTIEGQPVDRRVLADDTQENTDVVQLGRLKFYVIKRGTAHGLRVKDPESPVRTAFKGLRYFPIDSAFRVQGRFKPHAEPEPYAVPTVLGTTSDMLVPGVVEVSLGGRKLALTPLVSDPEDTEFFFIFKDATSGDETYPAGRYLYGDLVDGAVEIDFNKAYNPPCAFTPYATCPLPPRENWLNLAVRAGELDAGDHGKGDQDTAGG